MRYIAFVVAMLLSQFIMGQNVQLEQMLYPCVRVLNGSGGGSGTILYSDDRENSGTYQTFILTNHHVVNNLIHIQKKWDSLHGKWINEEDNDLATVELFAYAHGGKTVTKTPVKAEIVAWDEDEDMAILKLLHPFKVENVAKLLPADKALYIFQSVFAIGCPDLVDPIFTEGKINDLSFIENKREYIMTTADIIWGNSGGALYAQFDDGYYFVGIPSRSTVMHYQMVTYMGRSITPERIRNFIANQKFDFLTNETKTPTECFEARRNLRNNSQKTPENEGGPGLQNNEGKSF